MNKNELIAAMAEKSELTKKQAQKNIPKEIPFPARSSKEWEASDF